jgi:uncharacterized protein YeaO (DUF488 family)
MGERDGVTSQRPDVQLRRIYDTDHDHGGGRRVLVDRLWPRGVSKVDAALDEWPKDVAPSTALRRWYGHDVQRFDEFARRYRDELHHDPAHAEVDRLLSEGHTNPVILLTATRDIEHSGARVLFDELLRRADLEPGTWRQP